MPLKKKYELETKAKKMDVNYRSYLVNLLRVAVATNYEPDVTLDTRLMLSDKLKDRLVSEAKAAKISPEDYALSVFDKDIKGE